MRGFILVPIKRATGQIGHSFIKTGIPGASGRMFIPAFEAQQHTQQSRVRVYARREDAMAASKHHPILSIAGESASEHYTVQEVEFDAVLFNATAERVTQKAQFTTMLFNMQHPKGLTDVFPSQKNASAAVQRSALIGLSYLKALEPSPSLMDAVDDSVKVRIYASF